MEYENGTRQAEEEMFEDRKPQIEVAALSDPDTGDKKFVFMEKPNSGGAWIAVPETSADGFLMDTSKMQ